ncbi:MAG: hypothetical protein IPM53_10920 [Anaerolineaceae bacterium]|nr:hypothetical protein [Anaerolineaceae bacterium]
MIRDIGRLLQPLDYLRIRHARMGFYIFWLPLVMSVITVVVFLLLPSTAQGIIPRGIVPAVTGLLQILTGFYIAALAAVATFDRPAMDEPMRGTPPTLKVKRGGRGEEQALSRRRFLSLLFGYLSFVSLFVYIAGSVAPTIEENIKLIAQPTWIARIMWGLFIVFLFVFFNLFVSTLLGLYYLTDRIHRD